ncbi:MAG: hypothetical protein MJY62_05130 [Bacteroidales bacterium]|nr:hypothetical protein [Bacteroidales bacterium]
MSRMNSILAAAVLSLCCFASAQAGNGAKGASANDKVIDSQRKDVRFNPVSNDVLFRAMIEYTAEFAADVQGTGLEKEVKNFAKCCEKTYKVDTLAWLAQTLDFVTALKEKYPPVIATVGEPEMNQVIRRDILQLLDYPLHTDERSEGISIDLVKRFVMARNTYYLYWRVNFLLWLAFSQPEPGEIQIAKVYSSGYVFRTHDHTIGVDIKWEGNFEESEEIARRLDFLLVTHPHDDHMSPLVLQGMTKYNKPLVVPCENYYSNLVVTPSDSVHWWTEGDHLEGEQIGPVYLRAAMGDQGKGVPCNVYYLEFEGWRIIVKGDNAPGRAEQYLKDLPRADFTVSPIFSYLHRLLDLEAQAPCEPGRTCYYLPCHENEYHHYVGGRIGFHYLFDPSRGAFHKPGFTNYMPYILMDCGEHISIRK